MQWFVFVYTVAQEHHWSLLDRNKNSTVYKVSRTKTAHQNRKITEMEMNESLQNERICAIALKSIALAKYERMEVLDWKLSAFNIHFGCDFHEWYTE